MSMEAAWLHDSIVRGVRDLSSHTNWIRPGPAKAPHPEYLTTASIAFRLSDEACKGGLELEVACEEQTKTVWNLGALSPWFRQARERFEYFLAHRRGTLSDEQKAAGPPAAAQRVHQPPDMRNGRVDLAVYQTSEGFGQPIAVVENKGVLRFTETRELYKAAAAELAKDVTRNLKFVQENGVLGGTQLASFTFYVEDSESSTADEALRRCGKLREAIEQKVLSVAGSTQLHYVVEVGTWDSNLAKRAAPAASPPTRVKDLLDDDSADQEPPEEYWHVAYGVVTVYRTGAGLTDVARLHACDSHEERREAARNAP